MIPVLHYNIKFISVETNKIQLNKKRRHKHLEYLKKKHLEYLISDHEFLIKI